MLSLPSVVAAFGINHFVEKYYSTGSGLMARCFFCVMDRKISFFVPVMTTFCVEKLHKL